MTFAALDVAALITSLGTLVNSMTTRSKHKHDIKKLEQQVRRVRRDHEHCEDTLSAMETNMTALSKLLPGGEWYLRLGLDKDLNAEGDHQ